MKEKIFILIFLCTTLSLKAQKYYTKTGSVAFEASVPSFEKIEAENNAVTAILNSENGEIAALALVKGFHFKIALMEEHFNESYAESSKFPKATFKGSIENFSFDSLNNGVTTYNLNGQLTFHGQTKTITTKCELKLIDNKIYLDSSFYITTKDFDISIPKIVSKKISEKVNVIISFEMLEKEK
ncbi:hypothetical protein KH5_22740 [Urechidicola sp. KH5]